MLAMILVEHVIACHWDTVGGNLFICGTHDTCGDVAIVIVVSWIVSAWLYHYMLALQYLKNGAW